MRVFLNVCMWYMCLYASVQTYNHTCVLVCLLVCVFARACVCMLMYITRSDREKKMSVNIFFTVTANPTSQVVSGS